jgi:hypothetical protein
VKRPKSFMVWASNHVLLVGLTGVVLTSIVVFAVLSPQGFEQRREAITIVATIAGAMALFMNLFFTSRTVENSRRTLEHSQDSQKAERFFRASEQLGNRDSEDVRIAALFSLERLAKDSDDYYDQVIQVVCSFVRRRSGDFQASVECIDEWNEKELPVWERNEDGHLFEPRDAIDFPRTSHDIETAMRLLQRRRKRFGVDEDRGLDLRGANLSGLEFRRADFQGANFEDSLLINTKFMQCNLAHCLFRRADFRFAQISNSLLNDTRLSSAKFQHAHVYFAGEVDNPDNLVAHFVPNSKPEQWKRSTKATEPHRVDASRYLDGSYWHGVEFFQTEIFCHDLSGMRGMMPFQTRGIQIPDGATPPESSIVQVVIEKRDVASDSTSPPEDG